ncbi:uncharacterized protein EV422DRAFT_569117 [Fimicolochytrium jonesii]|uniref:uncharacterized protein n=1 Tax=Fimicolochytrium jonesii TaxID=1396493 RepID=UPI0022FDF789|nr:uncharacterized protein EV422DRAFT_569117 [Fimicolochytrium jonesii]KAI8819243.1 hypothetical protein EV422DRAFT_569117 [Fimicolochytrium jonesii]
MPLRRGSVSSDVRTDALSPDRPCKPQKAATALSHLPPELHLHIAAHLSIPHRLAYAATCTFIRSAVLSDAEWGRVCGFIWRDCGAKVGCAGGIGEGSALRTWREVFLQRCREDWRVAGGNPGMGNRGSALRNGEVAQLYEGRLLIENDYYLGVSIQDLSTNRWPPNYIKEDGTVNCLQAYMGVLALGWERGPRQEYPAHRPTPHTPARSPSPGFVTLYNLDTLQPLTVLRATSMSGVTALRFNSRRLMAGDQSGAVRSWRLSPGAGRGWLERTIWPPVQIQNRSQHDAVVDVQFTDSHILSRTKSVVHVFCVRTGTVVMCFPGPMLSSSVWDTIPLAAHLVGTQVAIATWDCVRVVGFGAQRGRNALFKMSSPIKDVYGAVCVEIVDTGAAVVCGDGDGRLTFWDVRSGDLVAERQDLDPVHAMDVWPVNEGGYLVHVASANLRQPVLTVQVARRE